MKKAIFTIVKNEKFFIKLWYEYYSQHFNPSDIYILNHDSNDSSLDVIKYTGCNIIDVHNETTFDHNWLLQTVKDFQVELLKKYDTVVFTESDEFIVPLNVSLSDYVNTFDGEYVTCMGIELLHGGMDYSPEKSVLEQKTNYRLNPEFMNKTLITKRPLNYTHGFHKLIDMPDKIDENLLLIHLHYFDYNVFINRSYDRMKMSATFEKGDLGYQNKYTDISAYLLDFNQHQSKAETSNLNIPKVF